LDSTGEKHKREGVERIYKPLFLGEKHKREGVERIYKPLFLVCDMMVFLLH